MTNQAQLHPISATGNTSQVGTGGAATLNTELRTTAAVYYNVSNAGDDIKIEGSTDNSTWRELDDTVASGSITTGGDVVALTIPYQYLRAYPASGYSAGNVTTIETVAKGP